MKSLWDDAKAHKYTKDLLSLRVYSSQLLGSEPNLVLHGGGNTSVKISQANFFNEEESLLYVKGSGWDLATIEAAGFPAVKMDVLLKMAKLDQLSDTNMVSLQRSAMIDPYAPNPSVEAILHAIIPFTFVDHTHADAVVTLTNTVNGEAIIRELYGDKILILPYVMPGFVLAKDIYQRTKDIEWSNYEGIILLHHGVFTFADEAKTSYENMINIVTKAEDYIKESKAIINLEEVQKQQNTLLHASIRQKISTIRGQATLARIATDPLSMIYGATNNINEIATRGPLTPDHVIRTKPKPVILSEDVTSSIDDYIEKYKAYFVRNQSPGLTCLNASPCWAVWPSYGTLHFGSSIKEQNIIQDIAQHTMQAVLTAEKLGGWAALPEKDIFEMEYWELEQAKLGKASSALLLQGKIALVTGAASGIGKACVEVLVEKGAVVAALDIDENILHMFADSSVLSMICDVTDDKKIESCLQQVITSFGGLDILVSNAGTFPVSNSIKELSAASWDKSIEVNLTGHQRMLTACIPYLEKGIEPSVVFMASKNVPAPGPGVASYSVAKAGMTQLARVASLELADAGIRVNILHPNGVFDTAIWTDEVLEKRAKYYGLTVAEYKTNNLLHTEVTSRDIAEMVCALSGPVFAKTTGAQIPIDGGNDRVI